MSLKRKPLKIPPEVARQFAAPRRIRSDNTRHLLLEHMPKGSKLRLAEVLKLFELLND
ncbi:hypothetical protein M2227_003441 [Bradyrhizobium elkanii]|nr:hypothetical protein [Bradyrhizobium elkanii]MCW2201351.1 hypothetical protein [Bradyrhizobium elkanii]